MFTVSRRNLASLAFGGLASMASGASAAIPPINRPGKSLIKLAVAAYSFRQLLDFKTKSPPTMTMEQFAEWTAGLGLGAIEPTSYYFRETSNAAMAKYKLYCAKPERVNTNETKWRQVHRSQQGYWSGPHERQSAGWCGLNRSQRNPRLQ